MRRIKVTKRVRGALMAAVVSCTSFVFGACGGTDGKDGDDALTLKWYLPGEDIADMDMVLEKFNKRLYEKEGFKLDIEMIDVNMYAEKMNMNIAANNEFDLWFVGYLNKYDEMTVNDTLYDITEMVENSPIKNSMPRYVWEDVIRDGRIYAVPNFQVVFEQRGLKIRKDLAEKYSLDISGITKTEDIEPFLIQIRDNEPDLYPFRLSMHEQSFQDIDSMLIPDRVNYCCVWLDDSGKVNCTPYYDAPGYKEKVYKLYDWYKKGYIRKDIASIVGDTKDYQNMRYAVSVDHVKPGGDYELKRTAGFEVLTVPVEKPHVDRGAATATTIAINKKSQHPKEAFRLIEVMNTDKELYNMLVFGLEGVHYKKIGMDRITLLNKRYNMSAWKVGNQFMSYFVDEQNEQDWEMTKKINEEAITSPFVGFFPEVRSLRGELIQIANVDKKYTVRQTGAENPDNYWENFRREMEEAGIGKVCAEIKAQAQRFIAEKRANAE